MRFLLRGGRGKSTLLVLSAVPLAMPVWVTLLASMAVSACALNPNRSQSDGLVYYQPPVSKGASGHVVRFDKTDHHQVGGRCNSVSPTKYWLENWAERRGRQVSNQVFSYWGRAEQTVPARMPSPNRNVLNVLLLMDASWSTLLHSSWGLHSQTEIFPNQRKFSYEEVQCWASRGDQLSLFMLSEYANMKAFDLDAGRSKAIDTFHSELRSVKDFKRLELETLVRSASIVELDEACVDILDHCASAITTQFPLGLPQANAVLFHKSRSLDADQRELLNLEDPEVYYQRALDGGYGPFFYDFYNLRPPEN